MAARLAMQERWVHLGSHLVGLAMRALLDRVRTGRLRQRLRLIANAVGRLDANAHAGRRHLLTRAHQRVSASGAQTAATGRPSNGKNGPRPGESGSAVATAPADASVGAWLSGQRGMPVHAPSSPRPQSARRHHPPCACARRPCRWTWHSGQAASCPSRASCPRLATHPSIHA